MKNNKGYTVVELIVLIAVVGIFAFVAINKASYAFSDNVEAEKTLLEQKVKTIETAAEKYAEDNKDIFEESKTVYIRVADLIDAKYLLSQENSELNSSIDNNKKIELILKDDKIEAHLEK